MPEGKYVRVKVEARRDRTLAFAKEHPSWTNKQLAAHLGLTMGVVANDLCARHYHSDRLKLRRELRPPTIKIEDSMREKIRALLIEEYGTDDPKVWVPLLYKQMGW